MCRVAMFIVLMMLLFSCFAVADTVVVGENDGCNLTPHYVGINTTYIVAGENNERFVSITFPNRDAVFTEIIMDPDVGYYEKGENRSSVRLPNVESYEISFGFIPKKPGLLRIDIHTEGKWTYDATVYFKILPQGAPLPYDINWDGALDRQDIRDLIQQRDSGKFDVPYYRCDLDRNGIVEKVDLVAVITEVQRLRPGYNPWDLDENGYIDIRDSVILNDGNKQERERAKNDRNQDGIITISDFILKAAEGRKPPKAAPSARPTNSRLLTQWAAMKK